MMRAKSMPRRSEPRPNRSAISSSVARCSPAADRPLLQPPPPSKHPQRRRAAALQKSTPFSIYGVRQPDAALDVWMFGCDSRQVEIQESAFVSEPSPKVAVDD